MGVDQCCVDLLALALVMLKLSGLIPHCLLVQVLYIVLNVVSLDCLIG